MRKVILLIIFILIAPILDICAFAQTTNPTKNAENIGLSPLSLFDEPPRRYWLDTANFKPENFTFKIWDKKDLSDRLEMGVSVGPISCKPTWGMFIFRVNAKGKVDSTWYRGNLPTFTSDKILSNIHRTDGNWIIKPGTKPNHVAWFVYPFFDTRARFPVRAECSETDNELLRTVSALSNLFSMLYWQTGKDYYRGTMIRPTDKDGSIKM